MSLKEMEKVYTQAQMDAVKGKLDQALTDREAQAEEALKHFAQNRRLTKENKSLKATLKYCREQLSTGNDLENITNAINEQLLEVQSND